MRIIAAIQFIILCSLFPDYVETKQELHDVIEFTNYVNIPNAIEKCDTREVVNYKYIKFLNSYNAK